MSVRRRPRIGGPGPSPGSSPAAAEWRPSNRRVIGSLGQGGSTVNTRVWIGITVVSVGSFLTQPELSWGDNSRTLAQHTDRPATGVGSQATPGGHPAPSPTSPEMQNAQWFAKQTGLPVEQILAERRAGMTWREIAKAHGVEGQPGDPRRSGRGHDPGTPSGGRGEGSGAGRGGGGDAGGSGGGGRSR
jgi:hypothetical protein